MDRSPPAPPLGLRCDVTKLTKPFHWFWFFRFLGTTSLTTAWGASWSPSWSRSSSRSSAPTSGPTPRWPPPSAPPSCPTRSSRWAGGRWAWWATRHGRPRICPNLVGPLKVWRPPVCDAMMSSTSCPAVMRGTCRDRYGPVGTCRDLYGPVGTCRDRYGPVGTCRDLYGPVGTAMDPLGPVETFMDLYGTAMDL